MIRELKMMFRLLRASSKSQVMYRTDFIIGLIGTLLYNATFLATVGIVAQNFGSFGGFSVWEIMLLYAIFEMAHGFFGFFLYNMSSYLTKVVSDGKLDIYFLRPYSILIQLNTRQMNYVYFVDVFVGIVCMVLAGVKLDVAVGARWLMLPVFVVSGAFIEFALGLIFNCIMVVSPYTDALYGAYYQFVLMVQRYPLNIFAKGFQGLLTFIFPLGFINYYPMLFLMGYSDGWIGCLAPLVAAVMTVAAVRAFHYLLKYYGSTGN